MNILKQLVVSVFMLIILLTAGATENSAQVLKVGVVASAPYAMKNSDGQWEGISIDLWKNITDRLGVKCEYHERDYTSLARDLADGTLDAGVGRLSALDMYDSKLDFTHAFFFSGLSLAVPRATEKHHWLAVLRMLRESNFGLVGILILFTLVLSGVSIWLLEHRRNPGQFSKNPAHGIWAGLWWSATTITTIGYGDKVPITFSGRLLALFWMVVGIVLISVFTATITSMCTVSRLNYFIEHVEDLRSCRVAAIAGSPAQMFLQDNHIDYQEAATTVEALKLLTEGKADAVIDDQAALKYWCRAKKIKGVNVLSRLLTIKGCSFVLVKNHLLCDQLNQALKEYTASSQWQAILFKYLGN